MKFKDYVYERYSYEEYKEAMLKSTEEVKNAKNYKAFKEAFDKGKKASEHLDTMYNICNVRYTINTLDEFYQHENTYWDETLPKMQSLSTAFDRAVLASNYVEELKHDVLRHISYRQKMRKKVSVMKSSKTCRKKTNYKAAIRN